MVALCRGEDHKRLFVGAMPGGLNAYIESEIVKQKCPVDIVIDRNAADLVLSGTASARQDEIDPLAPPGIKLMKMGRSRHVAANIRLIEQSSGKVLWAGGEDAGGERRVAEKIVKKLKPLLAK